MIREKVKALVVSLLALVVFAVPVRMGSASPEPVEIKMTAKKYRFDPKEITVKQGDQVRLIITALDRDHGFKLEAYGINQKLAKGNPTTIEFTASKPGTFQFQCSDFCGLGHMKMKGKLVVEGAVKSGGN
jgi:cytochrome c oxidase subunit 2